jgi:hypothetical protein
MSATNTMSSPSPTMVTRWNASVSTYPPPESALPSTMAVVNAKQNHAYWLLGPENP